MASFDFIESAASGYRFLMREHALIGEMAVIPLAIKIISFVLITFFELNTNILRQGLILIPSYFAEGWLVACLIRVAIFDDYGRIPLDNRKQALLILSAQARMLASSTIIYVLIKMALSVLAAFIFEADSIYKNAHVGAPESSSSAFIVGLVFLILVIWAFRFLWLYIPVALGYTINSFVKHTMPLQTSFYFIGTWLLCFVPIAMLLIMAAETLSSLSPTPEGGDPTALSLYGMVIIQAVLELVAAIVTSIAMAYGIHSIYQAKNK